MSTRISTCPKCGSLEIEMINPEVIKTSQKFIVEVKCRCKKCANIFTINSRTDYGVKFGVLY